MSIFFVFASARLFTRLFAVVRLLFAGLVIALSSAGWALAQAPACTGAVELWFLNDESGSVTDGEFDDAKDFLSAVATNFSYDATTGMRGALIAWDSAPDYVSGLTENFNVTGRLLPR